MFINCILLNIIIKKKIRITGLRMKVVYQFFFSIMVDNFCEYINQSIVDLSAFLYELMGVLCFRIRVHHPPFDKIATTLH